ncbi:MAG: TIGR04255 family protein [Nitrososphaera sp.]|nr:TIGR04255 family protein [Nitrososphaera sp.]
MNSTLSYSPINEAHAIVEVVMFVEFSPPFAESTIRKLIGIEHDVKSDFPKVSPVQMRVINVATDKITQILRDQTVGIELQSIRRDGSLEWMIRTTENAISVHCLDYSRWEDIWAQAKGYLDKAFRHLEGSDSFIASVGLKYIDRFVCNGDPEQSKLEDLFKKDTDLISKRAFSTGPLWHCHSGWFEDLSISSVKCLNQLNLDATFTNIKRNRKLVITVDHNAIAKIPPENNGLSILKGTDGPDGLSLDVIMEALHDRNKAMMSDLLSEQMARRINLHAKEGG